MSWKTVTTVIEVTLVTGFFISLVYTDPTTMATCSNGEVICGLVMLSAALA